MMFPIQYLTIVAVLLPFITAQANCRSDPRSAGAIGTEVASGHRPQSGIESPRANLIDCFSGETEFVAIAQGMRFLAPCRFVKQTTEHLKKILKSEGAKQPFALDVDHAHLAVTAETWDGKYRNMHRDEILPVLLRDTSLVAIYHSVCHTPIADRKNAGTTGPTFVGFYDGRSIQQLPSRKAGSDPAHAQYYRTFAWFYASMNKSGELVLSAKGKSAGIDIFFDDEDPPVPVPDIVNVSTSTN
jgi:hypothetical protein